MKRAPSFWWDFAPDDEMAVIVQSDYPGGQELARFKNSGSADCEQQIEKAVALIEDFKAGRKTPAWRNL